ncbi:MAG: hypothetical protein P8L74_02460 [Gammaproteobacteria bacterium]|nr:hypothetical protein [Gammaproteobacteria bacterium]MDG2228965.1 hypothetical protein [Gammaproteobacteria bacterium]
MPIWGACGHKQLKAPPFKQGGIMDIYISKDDERLRFRVKKTSQVNNYFTISIVDNKPQLYGGWSKGAFGGSMNLSKVKLWSLFLRELKNAVMKNKLNYYK